MYNSEKSAIDRRSLVRRLGAFGLFASLFSFASTATRAKRYAGLRIGDIAKPRKSELPSGGRYDHKTQTRKGYKTATHTTTGDEDHARSTTFWDGERR